ncbi:hypothetical protein JHK84_033470 [Glycine max]|nr:hypothetical protein JHK84_033470 [Glycine max]
METTAEAVLFHCLVVAECSESSPTQLSAMEPEILNFGYFFMSYDDDHFQFFPAFVVWFRFYFPFFLFYEKREIFLMFFFSAIWFESGACITEGDARSECRAVMRFLTVGIAIMKLRYSCPVCSKSVCHMSSVWNKLEELIASTPMPETYKNKMVSNKSQL